MEDDRPDCFPLCPEVGREWPPCEDMHEPISEVAEVGVVVVGVGVVVAVAACVC